jgi:hypothetical protein
MEAEADVTPASFPAHQAPCHAGYQAPSSPSFPRHRALQRCGSLAILSAFVTIQDHTTRRGTVLGCKLAALTRLGKPARL